MAPKSLSHKLPGIIHLGAENEVTGSCHLIRANELNILIDCGLTQGGDSMAPLENWPVRPADIHYVFITHAHIDHCGRLPFLVKHGFKGEILTTHPTKHLMIPMIKDAMGFPEMQVEEDEDLVARVDELTWGFEFGETFDLKNDLRFKFRRAGHILGSCFISLESLAPSWKMVFSGDLGSKNQQILVDPDPPEPCDLLILESTYGDITHDETVRRIQRLGEVLAGALQDGGKVFIPAFALGRTQEILYDLSRLANDAELRRQFPELDFASRIPVFLDSPLGLEITKIYTRLAPFWDEEARASIASGINPLDLGELYTTATSRSHSELLDVPGPHVIVAGSGMCTGGRIIDHLKRGIEDPRNDIVLIGYQAEGTPGRQILDKAGGKEAFVALEDQTYAIRAQVHTISGYSAHADQRGLLDWVASMPEKPGRIKLVHGEYAARKALHDQLVESGYAVEPVADRRA